MADGQVLIESKLSSDGVLKGTKEIKKALDQNTKTVQKAAENIEKAFEDVDYKKAFEELPREFREAYAQIETIRADDLTDSRTKAKQIAAIYKDLGEDQANAQKKAWAVIKAETADGSHYVIDDLKDISDQAQKTGDSVKGTSDAFKEFFGATLASDLVVDGLREIGGLALDIGKQAVEYAAEVNASNAQFEQTFKGVEEAARSALKGISEQVGITQSRLQDGYTSIYAFVKSLGADTPQAMEIASRAMIAAADSAAYYDRSMEETVDTLMSFLKGNYENDAALNVAATETTRNAKANEMYAKSFIELSEAQKVDVLLAMVEAANEASGALGQAAREADSWTNVTGELQEVWKQFLAVLGTPVLEGLIPIIQDITSGIQGLIDTTASADLSAGLNEFDESLKNIEQEFKNNAQEIEENAWMADYYRQKLSDLETDGFDPASAAGREYANAVAQLNSIYPDLNLMIDEQTGLLDANSRAQLTNLEAMKEKALLAVHEERLNEIIKAQADARAELMEAEKSLSDVQAERTRLQEQLQMSEEELAWACEHRILAASDLTHAEAKLLDQVIPLVREEEKLKEAIESGTATVAAYDDQIDETSQSLKEWSEQHAQSVAEVSQATTEAVAQTSETLASKNDETLTQIEENTAETVDAITQDATDAATSFDDSFSEPTQESAQGAAERISEAFDTAAKSVKSSWVGIGSWYDANVITPIKSKMETLSATYAQVNEEMVENTKTAWASMVATVNESISTMQNKINSLEGKTVTVGVVTQNVPSGASFTGDQIPAYTPDIASLNVPYLARGAVIPPRAPFMAMLGDQRNGMNLEAPEDLIRKIVREEAGGSIEVNNTLEITGDVAALIRQMYPVFKSEAIRRGNNLATEVIK